MEVFIEKLLTQGSPLVVLVVVVWMFLRYLQVAREGDREVLKEMHTQHLEAREAMRKALVDNITSTKDNTMALLRLEQSVTRNGHGK